jgi:hypothetical protein
MPKRHEITRGMALRRAVLGLVASSASGLLAPPARAGSGGEVGNIPVASVGAFAAPLTRSFDATGTWTNDLTTRRETQLEGLVGISGTVRVDTGGHALILAEGALSATGSKPFMLRAGAILGARFDARYVLISDSPANSNGMFTRTTTTYADKVPCFVGLQLGVSVLHLPASRIKYVGLETSDKIPSETVTSLEAGVGMSGQYQAALLFMLDPQRGASGGRVSFVYGVAVGAVSLGFGMDAMAYLAHDDREPLQFVLMFPLSVGTSMNVLRN